MRLFCPSSRSSKFSEASLSRALSNRLVAGVNEVGAFCRSPTVALAAVGSSWNSGFDNNLGDIFNPTFGTTFGNLSLSNGGISYQVNGTEFLVFDQLDLNGTTAPGGDDVQLDFSGTETYPSLGIGALVSWSGSGNLYPRGRRNLWRPFSVNRLLLNPHRGRQLHYVHF